MPELRIVKLASLAALISSSCAILPAQTAKSPAFEVASVKRSSGNPTDPGFKVTVRGGPGSSDPERITYTNANLLSLLFYAYNARIDPTVNPQWIGTEHYNIEAKIPPGITQDEFRLMLQNLLADRFHMVVHHETKDFDGYDLLVAKTGLRMKQSSPEDATGAEQPATGPLLSPDPGAKAYPQLLRPGIARGTTKNSSPFTIHLMVRAQTLPEIVKALKDFLGSPIVDKTGLTGRYDCTLDFNRGAPVTAFHRIDEPDDTIPYIPLAVEELGLRMAPARVPLDTVIVDSAEKIPTEN